MTMADILAMTSSDIGPRREEVLENLGIPAEQELSDTVEALLCGAMEQFHETCAPRGMIGRVSIDQFRTIYHGEGLNAKRTPLADMYERAQDIVLFALTIGAGITERISEMFLEDNLALAGVLDATASAGVETAADRLERHYRDRMMPGEVKQGKRDIFRFAPGYCGWHITGQKKLFEFLNPEEIGITLMPSFMMSPLKSLSGAIIVAEEHAGAPGEIYEVCRQCGTRWCHTRKQVFQEQGG